MRFVHTTNAICATTETGRVSGAILKRPPEWSALMWDRVAPQVCELLSAQPRGATCADLVAQGYLKAAPSPETHIELTRAEVHSGCTRVQWAERLILQPPETHDGRNSWLLNYGTDGEHPPVVIRHPASGEGKDLQDWVNYGLTIYHAAIKKDELIEALQAQVATLQRKVRS